MEKKSKPARAGLPRRALRDPVSALPPPKANTVSSGGKPAEDRPAESPAKAAPASDTAGADKGRKKS